MKEAGSRVHFFCGMGMAVRNKKVGLLYQDSFQEGEQFQSGSVCLQSLFMT